MIQILLRHVGYHWERYLLALAFLAIGFTPVVTRQYAPGAAHHVQQSTKMSCSCGTSSGAAVAAANKAVANKAGAAPTTCKDPAKPCPSSTTTSAAAKPAAVAAAPSAAPSSTPVTPPTITIPPRPANCTVSSILVNSCRPWLGASAYGYPGVSGLQASIADHERRIGRQLDIVHDYRTPGTVLSAADVNLAQRSNTILLLNWKPTNIWSDAAGGNAGVNSQIDAMANSIKNLGSTKIMLTVFHEPENDVVPGGDPNCAAVGYKGSAGTVSDYVNMWHNVRARFDAAGVSNVVWVMNYMGYSAWDCLVPDLWPGNNFVDWVMWDPYMVNSSDFGGTVSRFYNFLNNNSNSNQNYASKPWGLAEWGVLNAAAPSTAYSAYDAAKTALDNNSFPNLKAYVIFDDLANGDESRVQYNSAGGLDPVEQVHYNAFANDSKIGGPL